MIFSKDEKFYKKVKNPSSKFVYYCIIRYQFDPYMEGKNEGDRMRIGNVLAVKDFWDDGNLPKALLMIEEFVEEGILVPISYEEFNESSDYDRWGIWP